MVDLPEPPIYAFVDLRSFKYMEVDVATLRDSRASAVLSGDEFMAWWLLICASWHQVPAASLPDDDFELAKLAGLGRDVAAWRTIRTNALYGWKQCSDGRYYHPVTAAKANEAWKSKSKSVWKNRRYRKETEIDNFEDWFITYTQEMLGKLPETDQGVLGAVFNPTNRTEQNRTEQRGTERNGTERNGYKDSLSPYGDSSAEVKAAFDCYNEMAARAGLPEARVMNPDRTSKLKARLKECGGISGWRAACEKIASSAHCTGDNDRGWVADLDFMLQRRSFTKLMEGSYDDRRPKPKGAKAARDAMEILGGD